MAALTENVARPDRGVSVMEWNNSGASRTVFAGAFMGMSTLLGKVVPFDPIICDYGAGFSKEWAAGTGDQPMYDYGEPWTHHTVDHAPKIVERLSVDGVISAVADLGKKVYATSDNDFTTTPGATPAVGIVVKLIVGSFCDVAFFGFLDNAQE